MIEEARRIRKNSLYFFISIISRLITNALLFIIIARIFGTEIFGSFTAAHTLSTMFLVLADFGFDMLITTEVARSNKNTIEVFQKFIPIKVLFSFIALILLWGTAVFIPGSQESKILIFLFGFNMLFTTLSNVLYAFFRGIEQFQYESFISFAVNLVMLLSIIYISSFNVSIYIIVIIIGGLRFGGLLVSFMILKRKYKYSFKIFNLNSFSKELKIVLIFGFHLLFGTIYFQVDTILLMSIKGDAVAGLYQAAFKLMMIALFLPEVLLGIIFPTITRLYSEKDNKWEHLGKLLFKALSLVSIPLSFLLFIYPKEILWFVYGRAEFLSAEIILKIAAIIIFIRYCVEPFAMILTVTGNQLKRTIVVILAALFSIVLNLILIPKFSFYASIYISLFINIIVGLSYIILVAPKALSWVKDVKYILPLILIAVSYYFYSILHNMPSWIFSLAFLLLYSILVYKVNFTDKEKALLFSLKKGAF